MHNPGAIRAAGMRKCAFPGCLKIEIRGMTATHHASSPRTRGPITTGVSGCAKAVEQRLSKTSDTAYGSPLSRGRHGDCGAQMSHNGPAPSPRAPDSFEASEAATMIAAIDPITSVQMALISGFTPSRTSE